MKKTIINGYIVSVSADNEEDEEYKKILKALNEMPIAPEGYQYNLTENLEWVLCKSEPSGGK